MGMGWVSGEAHGDALIPTYSAHDAILSQSRDEFVIGAQPFRAHSKVDIITTYHVLNR